MVIKKVEGFLHLQEVRVNKSRGGISREEDYAVAGHVPVCTDCSKAIDNGGGC